MRIRDIVNGFDFGTDATRVLERAELRSVQMLPSKDGKVNVNVVACVPCELGSIELVGSFTIESHGDA